MVEVQEMERPSIEADEVLVQVEYAGVCGSDAHAYLYEDGYEWVPIPRVMGHEYTGTVIGVGAAVDDTTPGDRVVEEAVISCGECHQCNTGQRNVCQSFSIKGMHRDGAYAEYSVADPDILHRVPNSVPPKHAAIVEPLSIAVRTCFTRSSLTPGDTALVQGPGPIGTLVAHVADSMGARVLVSGLDRDADRRLPALEAVGIETVNLDDEPLSEASDAVTDGIGFDVVFDATGHHSGMESAPDHVRKGGEIVVVGLPNGSSDVAFAPVVRSELTIRASYGSSWRNFEQAIELLRTGTIDAGAVIDRVESVSDPAATFDAFLEARACKPVFEFA